MIFAVGTSSGAFSRRVVKVLDRFVAETEPGYRQTVCIKSVHFCTDTK